MTTKIKLRAGVKSEEHPTYGPLPLPAEPEIFRMRDDEIIANALNILQGRMQRPGQPMYSPADVNTFLKLQMAAKPNEAFSVLFLDSKHRLLAYEVLFHGTIDGASVYPRVVAERALHHHAGAAILCHNHPSGDTTPSQADKVLTLKLKEALALLDVRVLDHVIVGGTADGFSATSMAELGLL